MLDITVSEGTSASPEQVLAIAMDLSEERVKVWSNSKPQYFQVHAQGADFAEVTEGFGRPLDESGSGAAMSGSLDRSARP
jgi:hypothetical protein